MPKNPIFSARIIVATGAPNKLGKKTEIIDLSDPTLHCDLLADISLRSGSVGGLLGGQPVICGGYISGHPLKDCFIINQNDFQRKLYLLDLRAFAASVCLDNNTI